MKKVLIVLTFFWIIVFVWYAMHSLEHTSKKSSLDGPPGGMHVVFLDVGQGDSIYLEFPTGTQILVDGGTGWNIVSSLSDVMPFMDKSLDIVVGTHPHRDHIGGLNTVLKRYQVGSVLYGAPDLYESATYDEFLSRASEYADSMLEIEGRYEVDIDDQWTVYFYGGFDEGAVNNSSVITVVEYEDTCEYVLMGDAEREEEDWFLEQYHKECRVLKAGHHGSNTSTSTELLEVIDPEYIVVSVGVDNSYGHPDSEFIERTNAYTVLYTSKEGNIEI